MTHEKEFCNYLSLNDIKEKCSSCFTSIRSSNISNKYQVFWTPDIVNNLELLNWFPIFCEEVRPKKTINKGYQKHFIRFRHPSHFVGERDKIKYIPELILSNSYDGKSSLKFSIGLYRICSQDILIMKSDQLIESDGRDKMSISHKGEKINDYYDLVQSLDDNIKILLTLKRNLSKMILTSEEKKQLVREACRSRWDYTYQLLRPQTLLDVWREEDESDDLLTLAFSLNEKMIKGGWLGSGGRSIKPIKDPNRAYNVRVKLFKVVEDFYNRKLKQNLK